MPQTDPVFFMRAAELILGFMRETEQVAAVDRDVWLFKGNAEGQLAAYLQHQLPHVLQRDQPPGSTPTAAS
jgi:hypothetical protein